MSSDIELVDDGASNNQTDGLRFTNITVPAGATITNAYIQFQVDEVTTATPVPLTVRGELSPNPVTFTTATNNVSSRPNTTGIGAVDGSDLAHRGSTGSGSADARDQGDRSGAHRPGRLGLRQRDGLQDNRYGEENG